MTRLIFSLLLSISLVLVAGCAPRGETKSLDEVLALAQERFEAAQSTNVADDTKASINALKGSLDRLAKNSGSAVELTEVAGVLAQLTPKAGFTARPAMTELAGQYRTLATHVHDSSAEASKVKLLVARTYNLVASELESTKFGV